MTEPATVLSKPGNEGRLCLADLAAVAREALPPDVWDFVAGGSGAEQTLQANRRALERIGVVPRVMAGVEAPDLGTTLVGHPASAPIGVAPMAYQCLFHPDGEVAAARAAAACGLPYALSTLSSRTIEEVAATGATLWFQLYPLRDADMTVKLVRRAEACGAVALMVTVDVPVMARRGRDLRHGFVLPDRIRAANLGTGRTVANRRSDNGSAIAEHTRSVLEPALRWSDLDRLRQQTRLPLAVKGVLDPRDAERCVHHGASTVVVSNHGGRQFDGAVAAVDALGPVVDAVGGAAEIMLDSGVRSGIDVLRALALGAAGVLVGRPVLWGLAAGGESGVREVLGLLRAELVESMTLAGCSDVTTVRTLRTALLPPGPAGPGWEP